MGICFFATMSDDYMQAFKQSSLYYAFLQRCASGTGLNRNELHLHRASYYGDPIEIVIAITKYTSSFGLSTRILHLEGEEMFGSARHKANLPHRLKANSHWHDRLNFFCPKVANATIIIN
jgi:hypothetical protein